MYSQLALNDDLLNLVDPYLSGVVDLRCASGKVAAVVDRKYQRMKNLKILKIEWTIDEDVRRRPCWLNPLSQRLRMMTVLNVGLNPAVATMNNERGFPLFHAVLGEFHGILFAFELLRDLILANFSHNPAFASFWHYVQCLNRRSDFGPPNGAGFLWCFKSSLIHGF